MHLHPLYILRHGETTWNAEGRLQGHLDAPLTDQGVAHAQAQARILAKRDLTGFRFISSPLGRALSTARIACGANEALLETDPNLMEIGMGQFSGQYREALIAKHNAGDGFDLYDLAPGGEGCAGLRARCERFLDQLEGPAVLVTHGITSRMLRLILLGHAGLDVRPMGGGQGVVYRVEDGRQICLSEGA